MYIPTFVGEKRKERGERKGTREREKREEREREKDNEGKRERDKEWEKITTDRGIKIKEFKVKKYLASLISRNKKKTFRILEHYLKFLKGINLEKRNKT